MAAAPMIDCSLAATKREQLSEGILPGCGRRGLSRQHRLSAGRQFQRHPLNLRDSWVYPGATGVHLCQAPDGAGIDIEEENERHG